MSSPTVWTDARARLQAALAGLGCTAAWPNEPFTLPEPPVPWLAVEVAGDTSEPIELGGGVWSEDGTVYVHVMVPVGTGIDAGLALRKAVANLFRKPAGLPLGLLYRDARLDPLGTADDSGVYRPLTVAIAYQFQDLGT